MSGSDTPERLHSERVYQGRAFHVTRDEVRLPTGRTTTMDVVRHPGSVVLIAQPSVGEIILIRQYRYVIGRWIWELAAGTLEPGEAPDAAAKRECEEEIGLTPRRLARIGALYPTPGILDELMVFYLCEDLQPLAVPVAGDEDEQIEPRTFELAEAEAMVGRGEIVDMKTVVGLAMARRPRGSS